MPTAYLFAFAAMSSASHGCFIVAYASTSGTPLRLPGVGTTPVREKSDLNTTNGTAENLGSALTEARWYAVRALLRNVFLGCSVAAVVGAAIAAEGARAQVPAVGATAEVRDTANRLVATAEFREG